MRLARTKKLLLQTPSRFCRASAFSSRFLRSLRCYSIPETNASILCLAACSVDCSDPQLCHRPNADTASAVNSSLKVHVSLPLLFSILAGLFVSVALNLGTFYIWLNATGPRNPLFPQAVYSPAQDVLDYKMVKFHSGFGSDLPIYDQYPSDEVDAAWRALYEFAYSKIPQSQAKRLANKTYPILGDEPRTYMLALDVFHELHCLDEIRKAMYAEYYPHTTEGVNTSHMRHCLSSLRQSIMCASDVSTIVWQWSEKSQAAKERSDVLHTCRDFQKVREWGKTHFAGGMQDMTVYIPDDLDVS